MVYYCTTPSFILLTSRLPPFSYIDLNALFLKKVFDDLTSAFQFQ
jgi:hypothetical protein